MQQLVQQHLLRAQRKMKFQADKKRSFRSFNVGDSVYVKLQPYVQTSLANRSSNKLSFRFFGPFTVMAKIGDVAYQLQLPEDCLIHLVFHVSQLKQAVAPNVVVGQDLLDPSLHFQVPQAVLDRRLHLQNNSPVPQVLVQWSNLPPELSTWEDEEALKQEFPRAPAWGQAVAKGGRDVTDAKVLNKEDSEPVSEAVEPDDGVAEPGSEPVQVEGKKGARSRRPNYNIYGPDWV